MYTITENDIDWLQLESVDSTNTYLLARLGDWSKPTCVTTERQTAGRGRQGKPWCSPPGQQLLFSLYWPWKAGISPAPLSLVVAKTLAQAMPLPIQVKWPNDLQIAGKKLAGILLESEAVADQLGVVIGVGINCLPLSEQQVGQPVTSLSEHSEQLPDRDKLLRQLVLAIAAACAEAEQQGFAQLLADWDEVDALSGRSVQVMQADRQLTGVADGVDASGALRLRQGDDVRLISSGTVRLRCGSE